MPRAALQKVTRGVSPILLVLAALCFLLPFVGVSCNTGAGQAALGGAINSFGGASGSGSGSSQAATDCLNALNGKDLATYSGVNLLTGSDPSTVSTISGCPDSTTSSTSPSSSGLTGVGTQILLVIAGVLILVGILATPLRAPLRGVIAGGAALVAAVLVVLNNSSTHDAIVKKITSSSSGSGSLSSLGVSGGLDTFFNIHAALGFTLILVALGLAFLVNLLAIFTAGTAATPAMAGGAPPPQWPSPSTPGSAPPPSTPPPSSAPPSSYSPPPAPS
jgi:hypothetical protein